MSIEDTKVHGFVEDAKPHGSAHRASNSNRTYDPTEIASIFQHASRLQHNAQKQSHGEDQLTLTELAKLAAESGINSRYVHRAGSELKDRTRRKFFQKLLGKVPVLLTRKRIIDAPLSHEGLSSIADTLRAEFIDVGDVDLSANQLDFYTTDEGRPFRGHVQVLGAKTIISCAVRTAKHEKYRLMRATLSSLAIVLWASWASRYLNNGALTIAVLTAGWVATIALLERPYERMFQQQSAMLDDLVDRLQEVAARFVPKF